MNPSFTHRLCLLLAALHLGYQEPAQAASGPKLEVYLDGQTQPEPPSKGEVIAWGSNSSGQRNVPVAAQSGVVAIAAGWGHTVVLKHDGNVLAWGYRGIVPSDAARDVKAIAADTYRTVVLKQDGSVQSWEPEGGTDTDTPIGAKSGVVAIAAGRFHTVALKEDGRVLAWGTNLEGQLRIPKAVQSGVVSISASSFYTVARKQDGNVLAWGGPCCASNVNDIPERELSGVVAIAAGNVHTAALKEDGRIQAWGSDEYGQTSVPIAAQSDVVAIAAGTHHTVALKEDGKVLAWGDNRSGQTTVPVAAQDEVMAIAAGGSHSVALKKLSVQNFGFLPIGQFSERMITLRNVGSADLSELTATISGPDSAHFSLISLPVPELVPAGTSVPLTVRFTAQNVGRHIAYLTLRSNDPGRSTTLIKLVGTGGGSRLFTSDSVAADLHVNSKNWVQTWALSTAAYGRGQMRIPGTVEGDVAAIAAGLFHNVALKDGRVLAWGSNEFGQTNVPVAAQSGVVAIAAGPYNTVALREDGRVLVWGGEGSSQNTVPVAAQSGVAAISVGSFHTVALKHDGRVLEWGWRPGQKVPAAAKSGVMAIAAGAFQTVALKQDGRVLEWGGGPPRQKVPAAAQSGVVSIAAAGFQSFAFKEDGTVIAWGKLYEKEPVFPASAQSGIVSVSSATPSYTVALKNDGRALAWITGQAGEISTPLALQSGVAAIAAGEHHTVALVEATGQFGHRQLGTVRDHPIQVSSTGTQPLTIHNITLEGPGADQFQILGTLPNPMATLSTSPLTLRFAPNRLGLAQATLRISSDDPVTPEYTLLLQGTGTSTLTATRPDVADSAFTYAPLRTDPQTGLMLQTITYTNTTKTQLAGLRLILSKLASRVYVHSSSPGPTPLTYEVIYSNPIAPSETISFDLVYFDPLRRRAHSIQPIIKAEALLEPEPDSPPVDGRLVPLRSAQLTPQGPRLDWASAPRAVYVVEYSDDGGQLWHSAVHRLRSGGSRMFWIDRGQPETKTKPTGIPNQPGGRTYRIKKL